VLLDEHPPSRDRHQLHKARPLIFQKRDLLHEPEPLLPDPRSDTRTPAVGLFVLTLAEQDRFRPSCRIFRLLNQLARNRSGVPSTGRVLCSESASKADDQMPDV
jgi:hypothetical protein